MASGGQRSRRKPRRSRKGARKVEEGTIEVEEGLVEARGQGWGPERSRRELWWSRRG